MLGGSYGCACDLWSLGVLVYILLCGYPPFDDDDQEAVLARIRVADYEFDAAFWSEVSDGANDLVAKLLTLDPAQRLTAESALLHDWLLEGDHALSARNLERALATMKSRGTARTKLRGAVKTVLFARRAGRLLHAAQAEAAAEAAAAADIEGAEASTNAGEDAPADGDGAAEGVCSPTSPRGTRARTSRSLSRTSRRS